MSTVDPTKNKPLPCLPPVDPKPSKKPDDKQPAIDLDALPKSSSANVVAFYAASSKPLSGPGVLPAILVPKKMSDDALAKQIGAMNAAIKSSPGKINGNDVVLYHAMLKEAALRHASTLDSKTPVSELSNREVMTALIAFDLAKASGMPLNKEQQARYAALETTWNKRTTVDMNKELASLKALRETLARTSNASCYAMFATAASAVTSNPIPALSGSYLVIDAALRNGQISDAVLEVALIGAALIPGMTAAAATASFIGNSVECVRALEQAERNDRLIKYYETALAKKTSP